MKKTFLYYWNLIQVCLCVYAVYIIYIYIHYIFQASIQNVSHNSSELKTNLDADKIPLEGGTGYLMKRCIFKGREVLNLAQTLETASLVQR